MDTLTMREQDRRYSPLDLDSNMDRSKPRRYSIRATRQLVQMLGLTCRYNPNLREFRVNFKNGAEATAYYTPDRDDALQTARAMSAFLCQPCIRGEGRTEHDHDSIVNR